MTLPPKQVSKICIICEEMFKTYYKTAKFCSKKCKEKVIK